MSFVNANTGQHSLQALDVTGQIAAVYPSEDQLWLYGPSINAPAGTSENYDPGYDQNGGVGIDGTDQYPVVPAPASMSDAEQTEAFIHEVMNGQTPNGAYGEEWVNLTIGGPAGFGNWNEQPFFSGHSQIVQANPAAEQGWGVGPARRWAHYPFSQLDNPTRNMGKHLRMGALAWSYPEQNYLYYRTQLIWEQQWDAYKQRVPVNPVVPVSPSVPFVQTVPTYGGAPYQIPGIDVPSTDTGGGIYDGLAVG